MIERTFQLIRGVGPWREKDLWARGLLTWDGFSAPHERAVMSDALDAELREAIAATRGELARGDLEALGERLPQREHWRLYPRFASDAAFFDIEADGDRVPTVVSVFDRDGLHVFIRDRNFDELPEVLGRSPLWVTYNGSTFDLPILRQHFEELPRPALHLDLRFLCRRLRLGANGLKQIEHAMGFSRPPHLGGVNGFDAVLLWRAYQHEGHLEALRFLVEYNLYDAINLRSVAERGFNLAAEQLAFEDQIPVFERGDVLYDVSKLLLALSPTERDLRVLEYVRGRDRQLQEG